MGDCVCGCALESGLLRYRFEGHGEGHGNACEIDDTGHDFVQRASKVRGTDYSSDNDVASGG